MCTRWQSTLTQGGAHGEETNVFLAPLYLANEGTESGEVKQSVKQGYTEI